LSNREVGEVADVDAKDDTLFLRKSKKKKIKKKYKEMKEGKVSAKKNKRNINGLR
jgi:hypothetical protein